MTTATPADEEEDDLLFGLVGFDQADNSQPAATASVVTDMKTHDDDIALAMKLQEEEYSVARRETKKVKKTMMPNAESGDTSGLMLSPDGMAQDPALIAE